MPILVNYDLSTFRDHSKPNKRRLQELQHSEARAHAARVAYWRKRGAGVSAGIPTRSSHRTSQPDVESNAPYLSGVGRKPPLDDLESPFQEARGLSEETHPTIDYGFVHESGQSRAERSRPLSNKTLSHSPPVFSDRWHSTNGSLSPSDASEARRQEGFGIVKLAREPRTRLFDPFNSLPSGQGDEVVAAMNHYIHNWAPSQRPGLRYQTKDNPLIKDVFPSALQNVELFEATVALCLSFQAASVNFQSRACNSSLHHKGLALAGIREKLIAGSVDEAVLLATVFLMIIDNVFLDVKSYEAHLYGLRKMVKALRPSRETVVGSCLSAFVSWAESNALLIFGDEIGVDGPDGDRLALWYPKQPFSDAMSNIMSTLTPGFRAVAASGQISVETISALADTIRWTNSHDPDPAHVASEDDQAFLLNFDPRTNSARLMALSRASGDGRPVEQALCKALFIYHANILGWTCRCSGYRRVVGELANVLRSWDGDGQWSLDLWKWMTLLTANAARRGASHHLKMELMLKFLDLEDRSMPWQSIATSLKRFLLHSKLNREWKLCWETVLASEAKPVPRFV